MPQLFEGAIKNWQFTLKFIAFSIVFFLLEFAFQFYLNSTGDLHASLVRSLGLSGATFVSSALLSSAVFRFQPKYAKYWTVRRGLGVTGFVFIFFHILAATQFYFKWDAGMEYFSLNPLENPIIFGAFSFLILIPVALTSTDWAMAKMGGNWKTVQRLVYVAFWAMIFHFLTIAPQQLTNPAGYILLLITFLALAGELYWFLKTAMQKNFKGTAVLIGIAIIILYILTAYLVWFRK